MRAVVSGDDANCVELATGDITWPRAHFEFDDSETAAAVSKLFADGASAAREQAA